MSFSFAFGSFGDLVSLANMALQIAKALNDSTGASYGCQCLLVELNTLSEALKLADCAMKLAPLPPEVVNCLIHETDRCRETMEEFHDQIKGYQKALASSGSSGGIKGKFSSSWRKICWGLFKKGDVVAFTDKLCRHRATLVRSHTVRANAIADADMILSMSLLSTLTEEGRHTGLLLAGLVEEIRRNESSARVTLGEIHTTIRQLPAFVGYTLDNAVQLFHAHMQLYFKDRAGKRPIEIKGYEVVADDDERHVLSNDWAMTVKSGMTLQMGIVLRQHGVIDWRRCPRCLYVQDVDELRLNSWVECRRCDGWYYAYKSAFLIDPDVWPSPPEGVANVNAIHVDPLADGEEVVEELVEPVALFHRIRLYSPGRVTCFLYNLLTYRGESHLLQAEYLRTKFFKWICIMYYEGIKCGRGVGPTKLDAREEAAYQASFTMMDEMLTHEG
ncbi:hypothetical protein JAAARDRAFT_78672 [Jaapia argillacea MUCL 33604]|uniref:Ubiquitin-like domain-containing protein n=1 Tax=Jaapia argillacea MUCL 33604 TaxID=933084 RepID=A0A067Q4K2_9AGAM|nr:hypothetical protein JAAARDRAFT_78672 [Jaapia argillacea MUCL 33604]